VLATTVQTAGVLLKYAELVVPAVPTAAGVVLPPVAAEGGAPEPLEPGTAVVGQASVLHACCEEPTHAAPPEGEGLVHERV
jgi:hypothetical protein